MKALVLTYDKNRPITEHMMQCYFELWPEHPFQFHIPYQLIKGEDDKHKKFIQSPADLKGTLNRLLEGLDPEEWIFWSIDDKYPINLNVELLDELISFIKTENSAKADAILICHKFGLKAKVVSGNNIKLNKGLELLKLSENATFWVHHFSRVRILKEIFNQFPDVIPNAKMMDKYLKEIKLRNDQTYYLTNKNLAFIGESMSNGILTKNCFDSMNTKGIKNQEFRVNKNHYYYIGYPIDRSLYPMYNIYRAKRTIRRIVRTFRKEWKKLFN